MAIGKALPSQIEHLTRRPVDYVALLEHGPEPPVERLNCLFSFGLGIPVSLTVGLRTKIKVFAESFSQTVHRLVTHDPGNMKQVGLGRAEQKGCFLQPITNEQATG